MKGPSGRRLYRIERSWVCAHCGKKLTTAGVVVLQACPACPPGPQGEPVLMSVDEPRRRERRAYPSIDGEAK